MRVRVLHGAWGHDSRTWRHHDRASLLHSSLDRSGWSTRHEEEAPCADGRPFPLISGHYIGTSLQSTVRASASSTGDVVAAEERPGRR